jgi:hypothetical protein
MKKVLFIVMFFVFLTPMVSAEGNGLENFHCLRSINQIYEPDSLYALTDNRCFCMSSDGTTTFYRARDSSRHIVCGNEELKISYGVYLGCRGIPLDNDFLIPIDEEKINITAEEINSWLTLKHFPTYMGIPGMTVQGRIWDGKICKKNSLENSKYCYTKDELKDFRNSYRNFTGKNPKIYKPKIIKNYLKVCKKATVASQSSGTEAKFAIALGCNPNKNNVDDCIKRYLPSAIGSSPIEDISLISLKTMKEIIFAIEEMSRQQNQSQNEPSEEEKQQAMAQENSSGQVTWRYTSSGIGYWDYGNGFGWAPPNPIYDKIIQGLSISQKAKNMLKTGSKGRTIFIPR